MPNDIQNKLLQLVNEKNDLYRDVTFENVVMGTPLSTDTPIVTYDTPGTHIWTADADGNFKIILSGGGGGSGGAFSSPIYVDGVYKGNLTSGAGGDGALQTLEITVGKGDNLKLVVGEGGKGGHAYNEGQVNWEEKAFPGDNGGNTQLYLNDELIIEALGGGGGAPGIDDTTTYVEDGVNQLPLGGSLGGAAVTSGSSFGKVGLPGSDGHISIIETIAGLDFRNTSISLTGILNQGYRGTTDVFYRRHDLTSLFVDENVTFRTRDVAFESILGKLNLLYGTSLKVEDVANFDAFPAWDETELEVTKTFELIVKDTSYGWTGTVTIDIVQGNPLLESVVVVQLLPLLSHPDVPEELNGRQSGKMMTWMFDFTPWKDELVLNPENQQWANFARIQEIGRDAAGLDYWFNNRVVDLPTSAVPHANPRFERVKIQTYAGGGVVGPLYFHYDENW